MEEPRPVGRPRNPTDPEAAHKAEIIAWVGVNKRIRQLLEKQLTYFESQFKTPDAGITMSVDAVLEIMTGLGQLVTTGNRVVEQGLKALDRGSRPLGEAESEEEVMSSLIGGRG